MKKGQKINQWRLHSAAQLKEVFQFLLEDFDTIYEIVFNHPRSPYFRSIGVAIHMRIGVLRDYYPDESAVFIPLYQDLYECWEKENGIFHAI